MKRQYKSLGALAMLGMVFALCSGCTIIRYVEGNNDDNGTPQPLPPKEVDVLLMVELDRTTVQLAADYQNILTNLQAGLAKGGVTIRKLAVAPMYRRAGGAVPLIYGEGAPSSEFSTFEEAIGFYARDGGQKYLRDRTDSEGENLAALGMTLNSASIYHPTSASTDNSPYFTTATDGFLVVQMTSKARACGYNDAACKLDGKPAATYFTQESGSSVAWLELTDSTGLDRSKVFFLNVATAEGIDEETFVKRCEKKAGFNANNLDSMEPSANVYYEDFSAGLSDEGGWGEYMDMCDAMGLTGVAKMVSVGGTIGKKLNGR
jgi:hypothetical protein